MDGRRKYLKVLAFLPAIVLVGAFVGCHAGAFQMFSKPEPQPDPQPVAAPQQPAPQPAQPAPENKQPTFMPGSKSLILPGTTTGLTPAPNAAPPNAAGVPLPPANVPPPPAKTEKPPVFMPGSKSFRPVPIDP